mmetsp:Transcript_41977/g.100047  ORF Transcript_41977/g.100047 Transcript_41977/m.100047 type:complete len:243 (-) Transcript_41977:1407-2135(-)
MLSESVRDWTSARRRSLLLFLRRRFEGSLLDGRSLGSLGRRGAAKAARRSESTGREGPVTTSATAGASGRTFGFASSRSASSRAASSVRLMRTTAGAACTGSSQILGRAKDKIRSKSTERARPGTASSAGGGRSQRGIASSARRTKLLFRAVGVSDLIPELPSSGSSRAAVGREGAPSVLARSELRLARPDRSGLEEPVVLKTVRSSFLKNWRPARTKILLQSFSGDASIMFSRMRSRQCAK